MMANKEEIEAGREPLFDPKEKTPAHSRVFPGRSTPIKDVRDHAFLNMTMGLQKSSNVYVALLAQKIIERKRELLVSRKNADGISLVRADGDRAPWRGKRLSSSS